MKIMPKKRFGQHFLRDTGVLDRIIQAIRPARSDVIVEIGAGEGALTTRLAPLVLRLVAIEVDMDRIPILTQALADQPGAIIVQGDVLKMDIAELLIPRPGPEVRLRVVGNLPYNIATAIIEELFSRHLGIYDMVFMVQLEVGERIVAKPGTGKYGYFSVYCQHFAEVQIRFTVPPGCFTPRPKVMSAVLSLCSKNPLRHPEGENCFSAIAKAAFAHRRKTLLNSLRRNNDFGPIAGALLERAGIQASRRAEELSVADYESLAATYMEMCRRRAT